MSLIKIKSGNSFPLICTLKDNGNPVNPGNVEGLKVFLKRENMGAQPVDYSIEDEALKVRVTPTLANIEGVYRIVITGTYLGETINRNPQAFEVVSVVEKESKGGSIKQADVYMDIEFFVASIKVGSGASNWDDIQGKPSFSAVASSGDYNDLENKPSIPTQLSDLEDGSAVETMGRAFGEEIGRVDERINYTETLVSDVQSVIPTRVSDLQNDKNYADESHVGKSIYTHNNSDTSHSDIRQQAETAESIARGRSQSKVFETVEELDEWLAVPENTADLLPGTNLYVRDLETPDFWWDGEQKQALESEKVDLSRLVTKEMVEMAIDKYTLNIIPIIDEINREEVAGIIVDKLQSTLTSVNDIKEAIKSRGVVVNDEPLTEFAGKIRSIMSQGWLVPNGTAFNGNTTLDPGIAKGMDFSAVTNAKSMFTGCMVTKFPDSMDTRQLINCESMFTGATIFMQLPPVLNLDSAITARSMFASLTALRFTKDKVVVYVPNCTDLVNMFNGCSGLSGELVIDRGNGTPDRTLANFVAGCTGLTKVTLNAMPKDFSTMSSPVFNGLSKLTEVDFGMTKSAEEPPLVGYSSSSFTGAAGNAIVELKTILNLDLLGYNCIIGNNSYTYKVSEIYAYNVGSYRNGTAASSFTWAAMVSTVINIDSVIFILENSYDRPITWSKSTINFPARSYKRGDARVDELEAAVALAVSRNHTVTGITITD